MSDAVSRETLRDKREDLTRTWGEREAKFKAEKAGLEHQLADLQKRFERDAIKFGTALKDLDTADRIFEIAPLSGERLLEAVLNGEHRQVEADLVGEDAPHQDPNHEAVDQGSTTHPAEDKTDKELVLDAVVSLHRDDGQGHMRHEIERFIMNKHGRPVPPASISTYLHRLKKDELVEQNNLLWFPKGSVQ
jgi:hypothetical protein